MNNSRGRRWSGVFGVAGFVVFLIALPLYYLAGPEPRIEDTAAASAFVTRASTLILARATLADPLIMIGFLIFLAGFPCGEKRPAVPQMTVTMCVAIDAANAGRDA